MTRKAQPMYAHDGKPIVAIEYRKYKSGWKPFTVVAGCIEWGFDWCEQDGVLAVDEKGGGGDIGKVYEIGMLSEFPKVCAKLWYDHDRCKLTHDGKPISDDEATLFRYQIIKRPLHGNPFDDPSCIEDTTEWCIQCNDHHPSERMCQHVQYEDGVGYTLGCGAVDLDFGRTQTSLYRLLRMLFRETITAIRYRVLNHGNPLLGLNWPYDFENELEYEERYWPGIAWLESLVGPCRDARALTIGWLWMFNQAGWRACYDVPKYQFIRYLSQAKLDTWLALDPLDPRQLHDRFLRVNLDFKPRCANDTLFLSAPEKCIEVTLWPPEDSGKCGTMSLTLSVAKVERFARNAVDLYFGAVIERNGRHISELRNAHGHGRT